MHPVSGPVSPSPLECLIDDALHHMQGLAYSPTYLRLCRNVWKTFTTFVEQETGNETFAEHLVAQFLASRCIPTDPFSPCRTSRQRMIRAVMRILTEFHLHGCYQRRQCMKRPVPVPPAFEPILSRYERFCCDHLGCRPNTMRVRRRHLVRFLCFLDAQAVHSCTAIAPRHLSAFVRSQGHLQPKTLTVIVSDLRSVLRFLYMENLVSVDLSPHVPTIRVPRDARLPSVWRPEDVAALLAAVDRASPKGKRDYAILLLACRLGLRVGDIRTLRLDHLRWDTARLEKPQEKTGAWLTLPLDEEVGDALIDYLQHGRPVTQYREVFLRVNAPIEPLGATNNLHHLITFYRRRAGISLPARQEKGLHSLRHTVATRLLEADTPLETIAAILGHRSLDATRLYTKVDVEALRSVAIEVEEGEHA